jgi:hypothetical protein
LLKTQNRLTWSIAWQGGVGHNILYLRDYQE